MSKKFILKDKKEIPKIPHFSWGATNPQWSREASIIASELDDDNESQLNDPEKHYYLRDYN
ncbi:hypothetical protein [Sporosalibacterium faouarense]|uniref:hypothetical protein n=1 Tax=Sporosalibacterium faouarense TaxID=516123 RepID=UPI00192C9EEC|nr:hypothetical protein [Sporosalibacterium faouarense]